LHDSFYRLSRILPTSIEICKSYNFSPLKYNRTPSLHGYLYVTISKTMKHMQRIILLAFGVLELKEGQIQLCQGFPVSDGLAIKTNL
jgi:hypothetical protein